MIIQGQVGAPSTSSNADGSNPFALMGKAAELMVAELHGKYYTQGYRAQSYLGSTAGGGVATPIYTTTAQTFGIWNRGGNTRNAALQVLDAGMVTVGTGVVSNFVLSQSPNAGSAIATGGISAFTAGTAATLTGQNIGVLLGNTVSFTPSAATTLAALFLMTLNYSYFSTAAPASSVGTPGLHYDFDEGVIVPPNWAVWVANNVANGSTWNLSLRWSEPPL